MESTWLSILVVVNTLALGVLFNRTNPKRGRPKKKVYWKLVSGPAITPKHSRPEPIKELHFGLNESGRQFFNAFYDFGDVVNWCFDDKHSSSRWRLQELKDTELQIGRDGSPSYGRRYEVFCGPTKLGTLEIEPSYDYDTTKNVRASIELKWLRLLSFDTLVTFLSGIAWHIDSRDIREENWGRIHSAITRSLWDSLNISDDGYDGDLGHAGEEISLTGNANFYLARRDCQAFQELRKQSKFLESL